MTKRIIEERVALFERNFNGVAWYKLEDEENDHDVTKTFLLFKVQKSPQQNKILLKKVFVGTGKLC